MIRIVWVMMSLVFLLSGHPTPAIAESFVGVVKSVKGKVTIERHTDSMAAIEGMELKEGDVVITGRDSATALVFSDDTLISMGPTTKIAVDEYVFEPVEKKLSFVTRIIQGTVSFLSGQIAKIAPESVRVIMPAATIGVRGTHVLIKVD